MVNHRAIIHVTRQCLLATGLLAVSGVASASGFALIEQSVSSMGTAYANGSSGIDDASTIWFNPATMTRLAGKNASGGFHIVNSRVDVDATAEYNPNLFSGLPFAGAEVLGKTNPNIDLTAVVPHAAYSQQYNDRFWLGISVNGPFGLKTDYDSDWVGRYNAIKSDLITVNINPSIAYKLNDRASVGFGVSALYADGELTNALDVGLGDFVSAIRAGTSPSLPWYPGAVGTSTYDSEAKLTGNDWGYGWNVGLLLEPTAVTRFGLHYRSKIDLDIKGDAKITGPVLNRKEDAVLPLNLPASASASVYHDINDRVALMLDVTWTNWDEVQEIRVKTDSGQRLSTWDWDDTIRVAVGGSYRYNNTWLFRTGLAWDETPIPNDSLRSPVVPGNDRTWLTLGANYRYTKQISFDFGYAHLFVDDPEIKGVSDAYDPTTGATTGTHLLYADYDAAVDMLSFQLNWAFD